MFYNEFDKTVDYFYKCNTCRKLFISNRDNLPLRLLKKIIFSQLFTIFYLFNDNIFILID